MGSNMTLYDRVSHRLKLRDLRLLLSVMELGSMAKAAMRLNLTQSGVSKAEMPYSMTCDWALGRLNI
jgi:Bacterial regulatory helix-turn-helix protein, lysR family